MNKNNVIAIIQARMGSTRLPGKILKDISGKPMLWHVVNRLKGSKLIDKIVVATSTNEKDDYLEQFCKKNSICFSRGSEFDVLDRYYQAAIHYNASVVVRITSDCPLIDPVITDKVISVYLQNRDTLDGSSNVVKHTYPRGLDTDVVSIACLEACWTRAKLDYQREHVTIYIHEHPELFSLYSVEHDCDLSTLRWTVDEELDLKFVREIYKRLYIDGKIFLMQDVLDLLSQEPQLKGINNNIKQKAIK